MSATSDIAYFRQRVIDEKRRARAACEEAIRRLHLDFAARYAQRAEEAERRALQWASSPRT